jgi:hypothetical protein
MREADRRALLRRAKRRSRGRGAVIFIVAMTLAVLGALGLFALKSAATEIRTSGHERQSAQTHFLAEYGVLGAAEEVTGPKAHLFLGLMLSDTHRDRSCAALASVPATAASVSRACRRLPAQELSAGWRTTPAVRPWSPGSTVAGSLGPFPIRGDFYVELTEPTRTVPLSGYGQNNNICFVEFTLTSTGLSSPDVQNNLAAQYSGQGVAVARARIRGGPVPCP